MSDGIILIDAGPLVAYFVEREQHHKWAKETADALLTPFFTSEPILTEAAYLIQRYELSLSPLFELLANGVLQIAFDLHEQQASLPPLLAKYADLPMSLADATLVRLAELYDRAAIFTFDHHFRIYRKHGRQLIPTIMPPRAKR